MYGVSAYCRGSTSRIEVETPGRPRSADVTARLKPRAWGTYVHSPLRDARGSPRQPAGRLPRPRLIGEFSRCPTRSGRVSGEPPAASGMGSRRSASAPGRLSTGTRCCRPGGGSDAVGGRPMRRITTGGSGRGGGRTAALLGTGDEPAAGRVAIATCRPRGSARRLLPTAPPLGHTTGDVARAPGSRRHVAASARVPDR